MKFNFEVDVDLDELIEAIAAKIGTPAEPAEPAEPEEPESTDALGEPEEDEMTVEAMNDKVGAEVRRAGKEAVLAAIIKLAKVKQVKDIPKDKYKAVLTALAKLPKKK